MSVAARMLIDYDPIAAKRLFQFNIEEYPDSWHVYYDLAFLYKINGEIDLSKRVLLKTQTIEPENMEVKELLEKLSLSKNKVSP